MTKFIAHNRIIFCNSAQTPVKPILKKSSQSVAQNQKRPMHGKCKNYWFLIYNSFN